MDIGMKSSYSSHDVILLLKDITGLITPLPAAEREPLIQQGVHYSEMLPLEYKPSSKYMQAYEASLSSYGKIVAHAVGQTAERIFERKGSSLVIVSLARAGIPIGILIKHYLDRKYHLSLPHYALSIIRGKGIDHNAIRYLLSCYPETSLQFVDGWIGKGAIQRELTHTLKDYPSVSPELAVLSDPANITELCGTHEDILIPSSCLNCTVSGLISRTFLRPDIISEHDFHGAAYYNELESEDLSYRFIESIEKHFDFDAPLSPVTKGRSGIFEVEEIARYYGIPDINLIKPGIGEATRVLLRRVPWKLLIREDAASDPLLAHLIQLAKEKDVTVEHYPLVNYKALGIIKQLGDV